MLMLFEINITNLEIYFTSKNTMEHLEWPFGYDS